MIISSDMFASEITQRIIQFNPWLTEPLQARETLERHLPFHYVQRSAESVPFDEKRALLVVGPRQSGKSTLIWHHLRGFLPHILFLNMEDPLLRVGLNSSMDLLSFMKKECPSTKAVFIDEIQHMDEAGLFVKGLVDAKPDCYLFVSGSSSFDLRSKTRESLAGRAHRIVLYPFSLDEIAKNEPPGEPVALRHFIEGTVRDQLVYGSYPAVHLAPDKQKKIGLLSDLVEALILRDASDIFKVKRVDAFRKLLALLAMQAGSMVNLSEIASHCNVSVGTVSSHIEILEESHIVRAIRPYAGGKRRELTGTTKVFFVDNGVRNTLMNAFSENITLRPDGGQLFENWAFTEIMKATPLLGTIRFWRSKAGAEVDFVIEHGGKISGIEVKFKNLAKPGLSRSSHSFIDAYSPQRFALLNLSIEEKIQTDGTEVSFITPAAFPAWLKETFSR